MTELAFNQRGQQLGRKGLKTRQRITDATRGLLSTRPLRDISAMEIARASKTSVATFYIYFVDVLAAVLAVTAEMPTLDLDPYFAEPWAEGEVLDKARRFITVYLDYYTEQYAIIRVRNHLADEGDRRFSDARADKNTPLVEALARQLAGAPAGAAMDQDTHDRAYASAALLLAMVDRLCTLLVQQPYRRRLIRDRQVEAGAQILSAAILAFPKAGPPAEQAAC